MVSRHKYRSTVYIHHRLLFFLRLWDEMASPAFSAQLCQHKTHPNGLPRLLRNGLFLSNLVREISKRAKDTMPSYSILRLGIGEPIQPDGPVGTALGTRRRRDMSGQTLGIGEDFWTYISEYGCPASSAWFFPLLLQILRLSRLFC
jgi:hypothetical protein